MEAKKQTILEEIITTEQSYVKQLHLLTKHFILPLQTQCKLSFINSQLKCFRWVGNPLVAVLFSHAQQLCLLNSVFLSQIENSLITSSTQSKDKDKGQFQFSLAFRLMAPMLKLYAQYGSLHTLIVPEILRAEEIPEVSDFLQEREKVGGNKQPLDSLLILPVQRVTRYKLLLIQLLKCCNGDEQGYLYLNEAIREIDRAAKCMDESIQEYKSMEIILKLEKKFTTSINLFVPGRRFITEGNLERLTNKGWKPVLFHLFNDILLCSEDTSSLLSITSKHLKIQKEWEIKNINVVELSEAENSFKILTDLKSMTVRTSTASEKNKWVTEFNK